MPRFLFIVVFFISHLNTYSQNHVNWTFEYDNIMSKVLAYGRIDSTWHVYSSKTKKNKGPFPVRFSFEKNNDAIQKGKPHEDGIPVSLKDPNFHVQVYQFENIYIAEIPFKLKKETVIKGVVSYMVCNDRQCFPPIDVPFSVLAKP